MFIRKKDGFTAQKAIVLPQPVIQQCEQNEYISNLHVTDIGFYPKAAFHYRRREHGSPQNILIYCTDGEGWAQIDGQKVSVVQGQYLIVPQNTKHVYGASSNKPWSIFWMHFKGSTAHVLTDILKADGNNFLGTVPYDEKRIHIFENMYTTLETGYSDSNLFFVSILAQHYLASFCFPYLFTRPTPSEENEIDFSIRYMREHIDENITVEALAKNVYRSPSHFSTLFKKKTGFPPLEYFNHIKMQRACQLLEFTNLQIKELASKIGFQDPFYFSRVFTKTMGLSPVQYRKRKQFK